MELIKNRGTIAAVLIISVFALITTKVHGEIFNLPEIANPDSSLIDCNGDFGGTAYVDICGICSGGNTGIEPNTSCADCNYAAVLDCPYVEATYTYDTVAVSYSIYQSPCLPDQGTSLLRDLWFTFTADGNSEFSFEASNANFGLIVYSGTCGDLEIYDCAESEDNTGSYWVSFYTGSVLPAGQYFIQLLDFPDFGGEETDIVFHCNDLVNYDCSMTLDSVGIGTCLDDDGFVNVSLSGTTNWTDMADQGVSIEMRLDGAFFFYNGTLNEGVWNADFTVQGEVLTVYNAWIGNAETGCGINQFEVFNLPVTTCVVVNPDLLEFTLDPSNTCDYTPAVIKFYDPGTSNLLYTREAELNSSQTYALSDPPYGTFDVYIKPFGILQQAILSLDITVDINSVLLSEFRSGDLDNSNAINVADVSMMAMAFGYSQGSQHYNQFADFNCNGSIDISDISSFVLNFGQAGAKPPDQ